jgi:hypothetical protein
VPRALFRGASLQTVRENGKVRALLVHDAAFAHRNKAIGMYSALETQRETALWAMAPFLQCHTDEHVNPAGPVPATIQTAL